MRKELGRQVGKLDEKFGDLNSALGPDASDA